MKTNNEKIKIRILIPVALAIIILLAVSILSMGWLQRRNITEEVKNCRDGVQILFEEQLKEDSRLLNGLIDFLKEDKRLQDAWLKKNRDLLLSYARPLFENMRSQYRVTHFYFHGLDKVCFLRVHEPSRYGDHINRFTMGGAVREGKPVYGIELGPLGTFTLRVVYPWWIDDKLVGYIELGEEIEHITQDIKKSLDVELFVAINKSYLSRPGWEEGMKMLGRNENWDLLPNFVIVDHTFKEISAKIAQNVAPDHTKHKDLLPEIQINNRNYRTGFVPCLDAGGHDVGDIIVMKDITERQASLRILSAILAAICMAIGTIIFILLYFYINRIEHRLITAHAKLKTEIKERERTEEKLQHAHDELEVKVKERTAELAATVEKLTVSNRELKEFAYIAAHDLKSPVRAIGSLAGMISNECRDILNEQCKEELDMLVQRTERMNDFISGILKYATLGHVAVQNEKVDINDVVNWAIDQVETSKETIEITMETELPVVMGQRTHIIQIFQNLLDNAIKYMDKPKGQIRIGCVEKDDFWEFSVADNGPGIEEKYFDKIFQIFQTLTRRDEIESTGIGLSLVRKIVELYGGKVWVKSKIGEGSTFFFTLPKQKTGVKNEELYADIIS
ncbi:MAG: ATP-binding protein [Planctomycetota bacterium]